MLLSVSTAYRAGGFPCFPVFGCFCNYFPYIPTGCRSCDVHPPLPEYDDMMMWNLYIEKKTSCEDLMDYFSCPWWIVGFQGEKDQVWAAVVGPHCGK